MRAVRRFSTSALRCLKAAEVSAFLDVLMPKLGLTMQEGVVAQWRVAPGAVVRKGDVLAVVETDKLAHELESEADGVVETILVEAGVVVEVGREIARLSCSGAAESAPSEEARRGGDGARIVATPYARRLAAERGVALVEIAGSGSKGEIRARDVEAVAGALQDDAQRAQAAPSANALQPASLAPALGRDAAPSQADVSWQAILTVSLEPVQALAARLSARLDTQVETASIAVVIVARAAALARFNLDGTVQVEMRDGALLELAVSLESAARLGVANVSARLAQPDATTPSRLAGVLIRLSAGRGGTVVPPASFSPCAIALRIDDAGAAACVGLRVRQNGAAADAIEAFLDAVADGFNDPIVFLSL